ncbi:MAG TPA: hypothetical protein VMT36_00140 [Candidatus Saccharimonadia bacterium]|nr:hypothetical protein [Candidatus Saccharimonadia bacterium]
MPRSHPAELAELVAAAAADLGIEAGLEGDATTYSVDQTIVVSIVGATVEFRLRADVAAAAARTAEACPSPRGPAWVAFSPTTFDRFTRDRIEAWFEFAARQAKGA